MESDGQTKLQDEKAVFQDREIAVIPRENIGRWDESEHKLFLEGLQKYGNDWKKIANMVCAFSCPHFSISTRNLVQVRTHAQKYFQKINKNISTKSSYPEGRSRKESSHHRPRKDSSKGTTTSPSPVSTAFSDSSSSTPTGLSNFSLRPSSEVRSEGVLVKAAPIVVPPSSLSQDVLHSEHEYSFEMFRSPYSSSHIFEIECNNNWDDMEMIDCMDLKTPVFD